MQEYVLGFAFNLDMTQVILIEKRRPSWQAGKFNGVGGKIEKGEFPYQAMIREFYEETGATSIKPWVSVCVMYGPNKVDPDDWIVHVFATTLKMHQFNFAETKTDETIVKCACIGLTRYPTLPNLPWLIPLAVHTLKDGLDYDTYIKGIK